MHATNVGYTAVTFYCPLIIAMRDPWAQSQEYAFNIPGVAQAPSPPPRKRI